ncbi:MAG: alpha-galactosidase [Phaeodactylibacter sp.]|nr:alpha-galactosidase [Phaeodactylibacter sp.]
MKLSPFLVFFLFLTLFSGGLAAQGTEQCRAYLRGDTLVLSNAVTTHYYQWNGGNIAPLRFEIRDGAALSFPEQPLPAFALSEEMPAPREGKLSTSIRRLSPLDSPYLEVRVEFRLDSLQARRIVKIFPGTVLFSHHFYLKGATSLQWGAPPEKESREMIEQAVGGRALPAARIAAFPLRSPHWRATIVSFREATDHHNTLLQEQEYLAYNKPARLAGNMLLMANPTEQASLLIIKEAPLGESQHGYPGTDFVLRQEALEAVGPGVLPADIRRDSWVRGYGYAVGISDNTERSQLMAIRAYQKAERGLIRSRDEMILTNTWGDRSRDSRMNEAFILEEIAAAARLGATHLQLDDGWQQGLSKNSASRAGRRWDDWSREDWLPHRERFPNGLRPVVEEARRQEVEICLWFNPSKTNGYEQWERDADILIGYYREWGIRVFKIDGIGLRSKKAELNLRRFFDKVLLATGGQVVFNMDVTAGRRMGYHYCTEYGNIFLENRYTDWANYYPHRTLRNLWMLSKYVPPEKLQIEFLNPWRNAVRYPADDPLAPANIPFGYQVAATFMGQPLAWMELSGLPAEAAPASDLLHRYKALQHDIHRGAILPIGQEPDGFGWTGFQSIINDKEGFFLIFRENHPEKARRLPTWLDSGRRVNFIPLLGAGEPFEAVTGEGGGAVFQLPAPFSFALYAYEVAD